jgi:FtsH-binding integral membrane protein
MLMLRSARLDQRLFGGRRVLLEVPSGIHDISAVRDGPYAPREGVEMAEWNDPRTTTDRSGVVNTATVGVPRATRDAGLRSYMLSVYNYMASGVLLTGIVAMLFANSSLINLIVDPATGHATPLFWIVLFAPLGLVMWLSWGINRMSARTAQTLFWAYAALIGVQFSSLFLVYTGTSVAQAFFATAASFLGLSLYGYTTKRDLSGIGTFLIMGVVGLFVAMLINLFLQSPAMNLAISVIGVLIFAGLTAYDTQKIKSIYFAVAGNGEAMAKSAVLGALRLYIDFINMFLFLLRLMGNRR